MIDVSVGSDTYFPDASDVAFLGSIVDTPRSLMFMK